MKRERYDGPIEPGMIMWAPDNDGNPYRRDLVLCRHPTKPDMIIYEALPCPMRKRLGSGVGEIHVYPEINMRIVMRPEEAAGIPIVQDASVEPGVAELRSGGDAQLGAPDEARARHERTPPASEVENLTREILKLAKRPDPYQLAPYEIYIETIGAADVRAAYDRTMLGQAETLRREGRHLVARIVLALPGLRRLARWLGDVA